MKNTGTFRFIQNIAAWTARPEINYIIEKKKPNEWRPKGLKYKVNYKSHYNGYLDYKIKNPKDMKTLFAIDLSGSTTFKLYRTEVTKLIDADAFLSPYISSDPFMRCISSGAHSAPPFMNFLRQSLYLPFHSDHLLNAGKLPT